MANPRELIVELIGEEETERYYNGEQIEIPGRSYIYFIERRRGYADIVRLRVTEEYLYNNRWYDIGTLSRSNVDYSSLERRVRQSERESGRIRAWNIDDAVASVIVAARVGRVNWACGNIDVRLPSGMPPKNLSLFTFVKRGILTGVYAITQIPTLIPKITTGDTFLVFMLPLLLWSVGLIFYVAPDPDTKLSWFWRGWISWYPLYGLYVLYARWKHGWEVKMS